MNYSDLAPIIGTIINITNRNDCCSRLIALRTDNGITNIVVNSQTRIIDNAQLRPGMRIVAYYDQSLPMILIFPPQHTAQIVTVIGRNEQVMLGFFDNNLVARNGSLQLNIARNTVIRTMNGQSVSCNVGNQFLLVYYSTTTRSIPPQTSPKKIVVLCN